MGLSRFELLTLRLSGVHSNQLSYRPLLKKYFFLYTGVWPSGKASVFGTENQRFESFYSNIIFII